VVPEFLERAGLEILADRIAYKTEGQTKKCTGDAHSLT
jgi:hypothetical protein